MLSLLKLNAVTLNHEEIGKNPKGITKIKPSVNK